ncbi:MAG: hypothetical protein RSE41_07170 [Clostridia bacterium]
MIIGLDIDDTISETSDILYENVKKHFNCKNDIEVKHYMQKVIVGKDRTDTVINFYKNCIKDVIGNVKVKDNAVSVINKLKDDGHTIIIITARSTNSYSEALNITKKWLKDNNIIYDKLIINADEKVGLAKDNKIQLFVDDSITTCEDMLNNNIDSLLFDSKYNKESDIKRIYNFDELYSYIGGIK